MSIRHVVTWTMAGPDLRTRTAHAAEVAERLRALDGVVESIRSLSVGVNALEIDGNADVALVADFDDAAGLAAYQTHPAHQAVAGFVRSVTASRSAVDLEI
ncbi:Dabb family protein [Microbacterium sp.]|uniref:Dabb family protein n=1 Tax=Microbacterium sp. TaxID=51671 RepID=UPI0025E1C4D8|nr:Dabb family protein [Microbacterium sp.]